MALMASALVTLQRPIRPGEKSGFWALGRAGNLMTAIHHAHQTNALAGVPKMDRGEESIEVTAPDFAAWLKAEGETPSEFIKAWFDAIGVDLDKPAPALVPPEPTEPTEPTEPSALPGLSLLATPDQLVTAFKPHTGMDASWFGKLGDTPQLMKARKVAGQGGRGHTRVPFFCPFEVMRWLIDPKRRKGRPMAVSTGWRLFKTHFPKVHAIHAEFDPNADSTG